MQANIDGKNILQRKPITNIRWWIIGMAFLGTSINYVDRANLGVAAPFIGKDLHLNSFQIGLIFSGLRPRCRSLAAAWRTWWRPTP